MKFLTFLTILISIATLACGAQEVRSLKETIIRMDSIFFKAFNDCDTLKSKAMFTTDLEFYHDHGGLTRYEENNASIRHRCTQEYTVRRELVPGSMEVHPIKDFGAIQLGAHRFYYTPKGGKETLDGTFRFVHVWKNDNGEWKIARVISFDH
ncbi:nuclear transport factor 2 family protein [Chitinophaga sp. GCM10012297]|uniref:Nuclear transport factor 2 family protein n=1 Tax=Chitinophaga chungangae TaxID=2821488 RepID=A0ABS3YIC4_9BACT|nr:nuclear transport factor 2 family protein [Chitinophaga chungangae]MBO9154441.1 nuclear transport factor 2 family protein [Chitinophaga chungangae]